MKTVTLNAAQVQMAAKMGIPLSEYAKHLSKFGTDEEYEYNPNNDPIYSASIETLKNMWIARHGQSWVKRYRSWDDTDENWVRIAQRLDAYELLEEDHEGEWFKIKEDLK